MIEKSAKRARGLFFSSFCSLPPASSSRRAAVSSPPRARARNNVEDSLVTDDRESETPLRKFWKNCSVALVRYRTAHSKLSPTMLSSLQSRERRLYISVEDHTLPVKMLVSRDFLYLCKYFFVFINNRKVAPDSEPNQPEDPTNRSLFSKFRTLFPIARGEDETFAIFSIIFFFFKTCFTTASQA